LWPTTRMDWDGGNLTETWLQLLYQLCLLEIINPNKLLSSNKEHLLTWMECCRNRKAWQFTERMVRVLFCELMQQYSSCITYKGIKVYKGNKITMSRHRPTIFNVATEVNITKSWEGLHIKRKRKQEQMEIKKINKKWFIKDITWHNCGEVISLKMPVHIWHSLKKKQIGKQAKQVIKFKGKKKLS